MSDEPRYVPAADIDALSGVDDIGVRLTMRERRWRPLIVEEIAAVAPGVVADVGCGTGTLTTAVAERLPGARVVGVDRDPRSSTFARGKDGADRIE